MKISTLPILKSAPAPIQRPEASPAEAPRQDTVRLGSAVQVGGAVGAMTGALAVGRPLVTVGLSAALGAVGAAQFGWPGGVAVGAAGLYLGFKLEQKTKVGRLVGGLVGGAVGSAVGQVGKTLGWHPSQELAQECKGFSMRSLPKKLLDPHYTSHPKLSDKIAADGASHVQPGDIIITNDDGDFKFELAQKALGLVASGPGVRANWTHFYMVGHDNSVVDILLGAGGPSRFPVEHAFTDNTKAKVLRPQYTSPESREAVLNWMNDQFGKVDYDTKFSLKSDDRVYCQEFGWKAFKAGDPELAVKPSSVGIGKWKWEFLTADNFDQSPKFKEVWTTGSNFWMNWLSHFT